MINRVLGRLGFLILTYATASAADAPTPTAPCKATLSFLLYGGIIQQNPNPGCVTLPGIGDIYVGGAFTGHAEPPQ